MNKNLKDAIFKICTQYDVVQVGALLYKVESNNANIELYANRYATDIAGKYRETQMFDYLQLSLTVNDADTGMNIYTASTDIRHEQLLIAAAGNGAGLSTKQKDLMDIYGLMSTRARDVEHAKKAHEHGSRDALALLKSRFDKIK